MKKIVSIFLVFIVCFLLLPCSAFANGIPREYTDDEKKLIYAKYKDNEPILEACFNSDTTIAYWKFIHQMEEKKLVAWSLDWSSYLIEEHLDEQAYVAILTNLIAMQSVDIVEQVQNQSLFDNLKDGQDYAMDIVDIATAFIGGAGLFEEISPIIDAATDGAEILIENAEQAKYYQATIQDYSQSKRFLETVSQYAKDKELKSAARSLLKANDTLLEKRLEYLTSVTESLSEYESGFFLRNLSFALLKTTDTYQMDDVVKWYVDGGEKIFNSIQTFEARGKFIFKMAILAGDIGFGTTDTFIRYQEMRALSDIANAIVEANSQIVIPKGMDADSALADIQIKCEYYKMLISTHARGEHLIYQLLVSDAGLLSQFRVLFDYFKDPGDTTADWYEGQIDCFVRYSKMLDRMFELSEADVPHGLYNEEVDIPNGAVELNGHYYYIYDFAGLASDETNTWENALEYCKGVNGYLATITSQEENDFLFSYMQQEGYTSAYFGLSDAETEGTWVWSNSEQSSYTNWHDGEPNGENPGEDYAIFYYKYTDGTWNDGDFGKQTVDSGTAFICEWGQYEVGSAIESEGVSKIPATERDIVLVLDVSGSMYGTPIQETKKASVHFIDTIMGRDARIGIVAYDDSASQLSDFSTNQQVLTSAVSDVYSGGGTDIESGLKKAHSMLRKSDAKKKILVLMSDGEPNGGKQGDALVAYADEIKNDGITIYTLGFFGETGGYKSSAQELMERIASGGYHYEVENADDLVFFFEDIADQINGQKYIYVRIACPVDVTVLYNGESLCSAEDNLVLRTDFGTLTFEENEDAGANRDDRIKVLRLKEGVDYDVQICGIGHGLMDYTIGFMDENGDYSDFRRFEDIKITKKTVIDTVAAVAQESVLHIDEDGDGKYDLKLRAGENGYGEEVKESITQYVILGGGAGALLVIVVFATYRNRKKKIGR